MLKSPFCTPFRLYLFFLPKYRRMICTIFLCNKKYRSLCSFKRKGPSHLLRFPLDREYSAMFKKERTDVFALSMISTLSLSCLFLLCHKFPCLLPNHAFPNAHLSHVRAFPQEKLPLYFVACYYAQYRMRSAKLRNHLKACIYSISGWKCLVNLIYNTCWYDLPVPSSQFSMNAINKLCVCKPTTKFRKCP